VSADCTCTKCANHGMCRAVADQPDGMCLWCSIEVAVEKKWSEMLTEEAEMNNEETEA
jgi:hypothetical protein